MGGLTLGVSLCLLAVAILTPNAVAEGRIASEVTFDFLPQGQPFVGRVRSANPVCENHRRVVIKKLRDRGNDVPVGSGRTDAGGRFKIAVSVDYATYYAQVRGENRGSSATPCKGDRSPTITFAEAEPAAK